MAFYMKMGSKSLKASGINMNGSPLEVNCPDGTPPPCSQPGQAAADAAAEKNLRNAPKVSDGDFKETGRRKVDGGTEVSYEREYNQTGTGEARISYTELAKKGGDVEAARKWNAERNKSGTETKTRMLYEPIKLDPYGPKFMPMDIKANLDIQLPNTSNKPKQGPGGVVPGKGNKNFKVRKPEISLDSKGDGNVISRGLKKVKKSLGPCAKGYGCPDY